MKTFLEGHDLSGKTIYPFVTNGGWIGHTMEDIVSACAGAKVEKGINIKFDEDRLCTSEKEIKSWIKGIQ